jgi:hypothetical protein
MIVGTLRILPLPERCVEALEVFQAMMPVMPLVLTTIPLEELIKKLVGSVF